MSSDDYEDRPSDDEPRSGCERTQPAPGRVYSRLRLFLVWGAVALVCWIVVGIAIAWIYEAWRVHAARAESRNNLRQIGLATLNLNDAYQEVPLVSGVWRGDPSDDPPPRSLFFCLLPFIEQDSFYRAELRGATTPKVLVKTYVSPADPTGNGSQGECSYAANWQVFQRPVTDPQKYSSFPRDIPDGSYNIVIFAEIYQDCDGTVRYWGGTGPASHFGTPAFNRMADPNGWVTNTQLELFQVKPAREECSPPLAQTPHTEGMLVGMGDGSVRSLAPTMSVTTWRHVCAPADAMPHGDW